MSEGAGPGNTIISWDGYYYWDKPGTIQTYAEGLDCGASESWPTDMDGTQNFECIIHSGWRGGGEIVHGHANYGHDYPVSIRT